MLIITSFTLISIQSVSSHFPTGYHQETHLRLKELFYGKDWQSKIMAIDIFHLMHVCFCLIFLLFIFIYFLDILIQELSTCTGSSSAV